MQLFSGLTKSTWWRGARAALATTLVSAALTLSAGPANAANFVVNSLIDDVDSTPGDATCLTAGGVCTLRAAVQEANALAGGDAIYIAAVGTIELSISGAGEDAAATGDLDITGGVTIYGSGTAETIVDAGGLDRVFHILGSAGVAVNQMTLRKGVATQGGAIECETGSLNLYSALLEKNEATSGNGGAVNAGAGCTGFSLQGLTMRKNKSAGDGGAVATSTANNNSFSDLVCEKNKAGGAGGAISATDAIFVYDSTFSKNQSGFNGGAISATGTLDGYNLVIDKNKATGGSGGGIYCEIDCEIQFASITKNKAGGSGGGIAHWSGPNLDLEQAWISGNSSSGAGGAIYTGGTLGDIRNVTCTKNKAGGFGGGALDIGGSALLTNVTLLANSASLGGTAINQGFGTATVVNSIIGGTCDEPITSLGHNIETGNTCGLNGVGDLPNTDPLLGKPVPTGDSGDPTGPVLPLLSGSPAIDAGANASCPFADGRSYPRPRDADGNGTATCDIGAYEVYGAP